MESTEKAALPPTNLALRLAMVSTAAVSLAVVLSSNQKKMVSSPLLSSPAAYEAKFTYSSAIIYSLAATAAGLLHGVLTGAVVFFRRKAAPSRLLLQLAFADARHWIPGSEGNSHVGWSRVCNIFDKYCWHVGITIVLSLAATWILLALVLSSTYSSTAAAVEPRSHKLHSYLQIVPICNDVPFSIFSVIISLSLSLSLSLSCFQEKSG
ncbi:unnamed protein product [Spirodela intermedia]|uniref:CASP-like protein n=1 Tax=Spirodela intermedia TaxID=51605 RepID=A0A7I8JFY6_SPIIN|nr:unnamed protein product [Spirodela intermedia]CAA6669070.1 unnamed protein product [Spirodela intermedia]